MVEEKRTESKRLRRLLARPPRARGRVRAPAAPARGAARTNFAKLLAHCDAGLKPGLMRCELT